MRTAHLEARISRPLPLTHERLRVQVHCDDGDVVGAGLVLQPEAVRLGHHLLARGVGLVVAGDLPGGKPADSKISGRSAWGGSRLEGVLFKAP